MILFHRNIKVHQARYSILLIACSKSQLPGIHISVLTQFTVKITYDDSIGFDEVDNYLAIEADTMIDIVYYLDED